MLTPERLREIKERCERATPGPWFHLRGAAMILTQSPYRSFEASADFADLEFIAHAREDVPALVAEVERLCGLVGELCELVKRWRIRANDWRCPETWMAGDELYEQYCDGKAAGLSEAAYDLEEILNRVG